MAVYTQISKEELSTFIKRYELAHLAEVEGVEAGVQNSTFKLTLDNRSVYFLTMFENISETTASQLHSLYQACKKQPQLSVIYPIEAKNGSALQTLKEKPAMLFERAKGAHVTNASAVQLEAVGKQLAHLHCATANSPALFRENPKGQQWLKESLQHLGTSISEEQKKLFNKCLLIGDELYKTKTLSRGVIHSDLFRDNVFFDNETLSGIIDFDNYCVDIFVMDIAIALNDWCQSEDDACHLISGYQHVRPLSELENQSILQARIVAAHRLWNLRLIDLYLPPEGATHHPKDPTEYELLLNKLFLT